MKKRIILFLLLFIPVLVFADDFSITMKCPETAGINEEFTCEISANLPDTITGIKGSFNLNGATYVNFDYSSKLNATVSNASEFNLGNSGGISNTIGSSNVVIGNLRIKLPSGSNEYTIGVSGIYATGTNIEGTSITLGPKSLSSKIRVKSSNASLGSLKVGNYKLVPEFSSDVLSYRVEAEDVPNIDIVATTSDGYGTITGAGNRTLKYGDNKIDIVVKSETGDSKTYKLIINRFDSRDKTNTVNNLVIAGYDLNKKFDPETVKYSSTVDSNIDKIEIKAELTSDKSTFVKKYGPRKVSLKYGKNTVLVKVQAENETIRTYTLEITRIDDRDPNNNLSSLNISNGHYVFNKDSSRYIVNVENKVSFVSIGAKAESDKAKVQIAKGLNDKPSKDNPLKLDLNVGSNKARIIVTAENETQKVYEITINRLKEGTSIEDVENVSYLEFIEVGGKDIKYNQRKSDYSIEITNENAILFDYELYDGASGTIEIKDNPSSKITLAPGRNQITLAPVIDGSVVYMDLTSSEGYSKTFTFNVKKGDYYIGDVDIPIEKKKIKWTWKLIVGLVSFVIIVAEAVIFVMFTVKNGGVEGKEDDVKKAIKGFKGIKFPKKKEKVKEETKKS